MIHDGPHLFLKPAEALTNPLPLGGKETVGYHPDNPARFELPTILCTLALFDARAGKLLAEVGRVYVPFLLANAEALAQGAAEVRATIDGRAWVQRPFPYQGKCLGWLRQAHAALEPGERAALDVLLADTGCAALFARG